MENKVININTEIKPTFDNTEEILKEIEELNSKIVDKDGGEWINIPNHGICWKPYGGDRMGNPLTVPSPSTPPPSLEGLVKWGNTIDLENIAQNSVVLVKLNIDNQYRVELMQRAIAKQVLEPRIEKLKEKRVCILFMQEGDDISIMTEEEMNSAGWEKKEKNRIITI